MTKETAANGWNPWENHLYSSTSQSQSNLLMATICLDVSATVPS